MKKFPIAIAVGAAMSASPVLAENIEVIEVSADYLEQNLQTIPASVSIIGELEIDNRQAQHLEQILNSAANLNFNTGASRGRFVQIRGIGERSQYSEPLNSSVGFIVDDVDLSGTLGAATLFDVQQVEVLRGPQSTNFGASSLAGAIKVKTTEATAEQNNLFTLSLAQQSSFNLGLAFGEALSDKLFYRVALQQYKSDGFVENIHLQRDSTNNLDELTSRFKIRYLATDDLTLDLNFQQFNVDNGYDAFSLDNDGKTRSDEPGFDRQDSQILSLKADWQQSWGSVQAIVAMNDTDIEYGYDEDWTYVGFHPWEYSSTDHYFRQKESTSFDIRAISNQQQDSSWVVGLYASNTEEELQREYTYADADFSSEYAPDNVAVYGEWQQVVSQDWRITGALRIDSFDLDYQDNSGFSEQNSKTMTGGKLVVDYRQDDTLWYAGIYRGYKVGGFNPDENVSAEARIYDPEYSWNYEAGVKTSFAEQKGYLRVAIFNMKRKNTQVADYDLRTREDDTVEFIDVISNADNGRNTGVEMEMEYYASEQLKLNISAGYLDAVYGDYSRIDGSYVEQRQQAQAPDFTGSISAEYLFSQSWSAFVNLDGKSSYYFSDGHEEKAPSYALLNANVRWQSDATDVTIWVKNLTDKEYYTRGFGGFSNDPREYYEIPKPYYQLGDGRQFGVTFNYHF